MQNLPLVLTLALWSSFPMLCCNAERPNVLVVMVDDLGYSDLGCYGSEIATPNLDRLADNGLRFSQFYNTAKCHSSRVSLLTGQYCLAAGDTALDHAVTSAEVLSSAGYFTAMTGKWHLKQEPTDFGFQKYFGHLSGACNYFSGDNTFRLNGEPWKVPDNDFYTTVADVDYGIQFLNTARETKKPWYLYVAFNAPHAPLHALPEDYQKYQGKYAAGWDAIRERRIAKQKKIGLLPHELQESRRPEHIPAWENLKPWQRDYEADRMSTLAAMIDRVDQEIGRLIQDLESHDELDNTLILFVSDNGACPYDRKQPDLDMTPTDAGHSYGDSTGWAWARNSPFRYYKQNQFEGGISSPAIVHWPNGLEASQGSITNQPAHLIDVLPTLADLTNSEIPDAYAERDLRPISGISLRPILEGKTMEERPPIHFLFSSDRGLRDGPWKLVSFQGADWELYNLAEDRCETTNLATKEPDRLQEMISLWDKMASDVLHASTSVRQPVKTQPLPHRHREWTNFDAETVEEYTPRTKKRDKSNPRKRIRARKNTKMEITDKEIRLTFNGEDPGIAMDLRGVSLAPGPYHLSFRLSVEGIAKEARAGEVFFTTNPRTTLPKGERVPFEFTETTAWQEISVPLTTKEQINQLRLDIAEGTGKARIAELRLMNSEHQPLVEWPK